MNSAEDLDAPLRRARHALVSHAQARRAHAAALHQRQRDLLGRLMQPSGLREATAAVENSLEGLMDVCGAEVAMDGFAVMNMRGSSAVLFWSQQLQDAHDFAKAHPELSPDVFPMTLREAVEQRAERVRFALPALSHAQLMRDREAIQRDLADAEARIKELRAELQVAA